MRARSAPPPPAPPRPGRAYGAACFALELDPGGPCGPVLAIDGAGVAAGALTLPVGDAGVAALLAPGAVVPGDLGLELGTALSIDLARWLEAFVAGRAERRDGAILAGDFELSVRARRGFRGALIRELTLPGFDAAAAGTAPCAIGIKLAPERIDLGFGAEVAAPLPAAAPAPRRRSWSAHRFELALDGLEDATRRTARVEPLTIRQAIVDYRAGELADPVRLPGRLEWPTLAFHVPEADLAPLAARLGDASAGVDGQLAPLDDDGAPLAAIEIAAARVVGIGADRGSARAEELKLVRVEVAIAALKLTHISDGGAA